MIATASSGHIAALYAARIVSGLGIGALTVTGPVSIVEIAPTETRGLMAVWFSVAMLLSLFVAVFCTYGVFLHVAASSLQYQIVFFAPCIFMALMCALSFAPFCLESPRWLFLTGNSERASESLVLLRGLGDSHPRLLSERDEILAQAEKERAQYGNVARSTSWTGIRATFTEAFTVKANLRRVQQALVSYALAQLSGANSITAYFVPILKLIGAASDDKAQSLFLTGMYSFAKFCFTLIASFFFIDALGRRKSLFTGIILQMVSDIYVGVFIKYKQSGPVSSSSSQAAIAMIFIHGFGYAVGLLVLPYVFGAEVWPNQLRSFGSALAQTFHWLFFFGISRGTPSILSSMDNWGAFLFFAGWCFVSLVYVYLVVPETAGQSLEEIDELFEGSWFMAWRSDKKKVKDIEVLDGHGPSVDSGNPPKTMNQSTKAPDVSA
ncbi:putative quinate permease [Pseudocercospora fuligena]|uniref:Putative quinate permease n=1 Tax=Pseudocercospora fuligena TaxID=685502 RepID=A0A8H6RGT7_9PEZI|nr:putative quinate permease [Pseudocercospora fuligena]